MKEKNIIVPGDTGAVIVECTDDGDVRISLKWSDVVFVISVDDITPSGVVLDIYAEEK